jgi:DNA-binding YbaB/EbfC family protein
MGVDRKLLKQVQDMQANMARAQQEVLASVVEGSSGGGMVTVRLSGKQELESVALSPDVVDPEDIEMLQDLIRAAVNDALKRLAELTELKMSAVTGGMPSIPGLPF